MGSEGISWIELLPSAMVGLIMVVSLGNRDITLGYLYQS